ncbi:MAG: hypothetical protein ABJG78_01345 [Cyclobacteriaceae bacterium]
MLQLPIVHKNRKRWAKIVKTTFLLSIALLFGYIWIEDYVDESFQKLPYFILVVLTIGTGIIINIPLRRHREIGQIIFSQNSITTLIFNKPTELLISELDKLEINIVGHHGQDISTIPRIFIADGTGNFVTTHKNGNSKKTEFFLNNIEQVNSLRNLAVEYEQLTSVQLTGLHQ